MLLLAFQSLPLWLGAVLAFSLFWALLRSVLGSAWFKGQRGERRVRRMLRRGLKAPSYLALHNVTLDAPGGSTQIDHVVVSCFGIFVIETKNLRGHITGSERQPQWTQTLGRHSFSFQNPLHQNYRHTQALVATLQVPPGQVHSVIAFVGRSHLPEDRPANVTQGSGCVRFVRTFTQPVWTQDQVQALAQQLQAQHLAPTRATHRAHVQQLKKRHSPAGQRACPACASPMVLRTAKVGAHAGQSFWGCSAFPQCREVQSAAAY